MLLYVVNGDLQPRHKLALIRRRCATIPICSFWCVGQSVFMWQTYFFFLYTSYSSCICVCQSVQNGFFQLWRALQCLCSLTLQMKSFHFLTTEKSWRVQRGGGRGGGERQESHKKRCKGKAGFQFNKHCRTCSLPELWPGDEVLQKLNHERTWGHPAVIMDQCTPRSYLVRTPQRQCGWKQKHIRLSSSSSCLPKFFIHHCMSLQASDEKSPLTHTSTEPNSQKGSTSPDSPRKHPAYYPGQSDPDPTVSMTGRPICYTSMVNNPKWTCDQNPSMLQRLKLCCKLLQILCSFQ